MTDDEHADRLMRLKLIQPDRCRRCGEIYMLCPHTNCTGGPIPDDHATRIRARYAIGKRFDPDNHDTNDYFTDQPEPGGACAPAGDE
jgi:hypothetical protein